MYRINFIAKYYLKIRVKKNDTNLTTKYISFFSYIFFLFYISDDWA